MKHVVIIGASVAGHTVAMMLRETNKECGITLLEEGSLPCYDKRRFGDFLSFQANAQELAVASEDHYRSLSIDFLKDFKAANVTFQKNQVFGKNLQALKFDFLVIASGRRYVVPEIPGARKTGVFCLSSFADVKEFQEYVFGESVCVVGANRWARDIAEHLASKRKEVKLILGESAPATDHSQSFSPQMEVITEQLVEIIGESQVQAVKLKSGKVIATHSVLYMDEVKSNTEFLKNTPVTLCRDLVCVNDRMQTNLANVFACGAVCTLSGQEAALKSWEEVEGESRLVAQQLQAVLQVPEVTSVDFS